LLFGLLADSRCHQEAAAETTTADARAPALSGRLADAVLRLRRRRDRGPERLSGFEDRPEAGLGAEPSRAVPARCKPRRPRVAAAGTWAWRELGQRNPRVATAPSSQARRHRATLRVGQEGAAVHRRRRLDAGHIARRQAP